MEMMMEDDCQGKIVKVKGYFFRSLARWLVEQLAGYVLRNNY
jgi:hypothetical protein